LSTEFEIPPEIDTWNPILNPNAIVKIGYRLYIF